ncbi:hypothetical protein DFQ01_1214 [Paenibacillus cellulosilyticus]|uniref:Uncharacterized protein n=1 Tax=Paenibacillus cellulosilyticus TaxID=375489 RepID=A0A2V2YS02_9BACL|nr:hypothetical protein [Paenibacillus cellulosilyticus]PWV97362.1 hypothetical protein DFQ01_1214 [Paenibacillus cellulosilyticus]QKS48593.1 hypothetical protein HUB94_30655 [Paenibacillus cellulosilyticus]
MQEDMIVQANGTVKLENYIFSGLDSSVVGAVKSVADYYQIPVTASRIYGMTGLAFLHVLDDDMVEPNGGPPDPEVYRLARNIGFNIEGFHTTAEGEEFTRLQAEAWDRARQAISAGQPVFAKNIDIRNQTSVIYAHDDIGYYRYNWHTGYENSEDVIPWNSLGLGQCPCIHCVNDRKSSGTLTDQSSGLISLHWGEPIQSADERTSLKEALEFVIRLNEQGSYQSFGKSYLVGSQAYEKWLSALESNKLDKYFFSLFIEILFEARSHAITFLTELKGNLDHLNSGIIDELIHTYTEIASKYKVLKETYPYTEPREFELKQSEQCAVILRELMALDGEAMGRIKEIYSAL